MSKPLRKRGIIRKDKMMKAANYLFLKNGYEKTITASIAKASAMSPPSFFAAFESKENLLRELVKDFSDHTPESMKKSFDGLQDRLLFFAAENALSMYITELSETLKEMYVMAYSMPLPSEYIYEKTLERYSDVFSELLPEKTALYEMNIAACGMKRAFLAQRCNLYFTVDQKTERYLECCLTMYHIPEEKQQQMIQAVLQMDLKKVAQDVIDEMTKNAEEGWASIQ